MSHSTEQQRPEPTALWAEGEHEKPRSPTFDDVEDSQIPPGIFKELANNVVLCKLYQCQWPIPTMLRHFYSTVNIPTWSRVVTLNKEECLPYAVERCSYLLEIGMGSGPLPLAPSCLCKRSSIYTPNAGLVWDSIYDSKALEPKEDQIRVLEILPRSGPEIQCRLSCVTLIEGLGYEALSYVWGHASTGTDKAIDIEGKKFLVTRNCYDALDSLSSTMSSRVLWVDAICINQNDELEKSSQIKLMAKIYKLASRVVVFCGLCPPGCEALFNYFNRDRSLDSVPVKPNDDSDGDRLPLEQFTTLAPFNYFNRDRSLDSVPVQPNDESDGDRLPLEQFTTFCGLPWFGRVWTQQEFCLPSADPSFYLGEQSTVSSNIIKDMRMLATKATTREAMQLVRDLINRNPIPAGAEPMKVNSAARLQALSLLNQRTVYRSAEQGHIPISVLLARDRGKATDPRDVIYGRLEFFDPIVQEIFPPDYTIAACRLFQKVAIWCLVFDNNLDIYWRFPHKLPTTCSAPSWVPDFTKRHEQLTEDVQPLEHGRKLTTAAAICNGVLTLHGRGLGCIQEVFQVDGREWLNEAACLWRLDNYFAQLHTGAASITAQTDLAVHLSRLHQELRITRWTRCTRNLDEKKIRVPLDPISLFSKRFSFYQYGLVIMTAFDRILRDIMGALYSLEEGIALEHGTTPTPSEKSAVCAVLNGVRSRLELLYAGLMAIPGAYTGAPDLLGAAIFDYDNLESQLKNVRQPDLPAPSISENVSQLAASYLRHFPTNASPEATAGTFAAPITPPDISSLPPVQYRDLQQAITTCELDEEVQLRSRWVLAIARELNRAVLGPGASRQGDQANSTITSPGVPTEYESALRDDIENYAQLAQAGKAQYLSRCETIQQRLEKRSFFVTNGRLIGLGLTGVRDIRVGDELVMTEISNTPLILRPTTKAGYYRHVGLTCVKGLMDGEFHKLKEYQKPERQVFRIE